MYVGVSQRFFLCVFFNNTTLGGGFKYFLFSPLFGGMIHFDSYFSDGLKPKTSFCFFQQYS